MAQSVLGLDLGTRNIKYVELAHMGKGRYQLLSVGLSPTTSKGAASDAPIDQEALASQIRKLLKDGGVRSKTVNLALPDASVFTHIIQVPPLSERELATAIKWEAEQYIPLPLEEVQMDFSIVGQSLDKDNNKKLDILLVAAPKILIDRYMKILDLADLEVASLETEIISASRALIPAAIDKPLTVMVVNLGAQTTDFSILRGGVIAFTRSIPLGGMNLTKVLAQDLGLPPSQAEEYKKTYGLGKTVLEGKVYKVLQPLFNNLIDEVKRAITFFQSKYLDEPISAIILSGGTAKLPNLVEYIVEAVGIETQIGTPWTKVDKDSKRFTRLEEEGAVFAVAVGLAMRED